MPGEGARIRTLREDETVAEGGTRETKGGCGPVPPRGRTTHILVVPAIGLIHHLPVESLNEPGSPPSSAGGSRFTRIGVGLFSSRRARSSTGAPASSLSTLLGALRRTLLLTRAPDAEAPPTCSVSCSSEDTIVPSALAHSRRVPMNFSTVDARVRERAPSTARPSPRGDVSLAREASMPIAARRAPPRLSGHTLVWGNPTSSRRVTTRRIRPDSRFPLATWQRNVHAVRRSSRISGALPAVLGPAGTTP